MIALSNRSRPRWPMQAYCRRRGDVPIVAGIQPRPGPCDGARLPFCLAAGLTRQDSVMSLPAGQQRALNLIEKTLTDDHPGLGPLFAIFTRLTGHEPMP